MIHHFSCLEIMDGSLCCGCGFATLPIFGKEQNAKSPWTRLTLRKVRTPSYRHYFWWCKKGPIQCWCVMDDVMNNYYWSNLKSTRGHVNIFFIFIVIVRRGGERYRIYRDRFAVWTAGKIIYYFTYLGQLFPILLLVLPPEHKQLSNQPTNRTKQPTIPTHIIYSWERGGILTTILLCPQRQRVIAERISLERVKKEYGM